MATQEQRARLYVSLEPGLHERFALIAESNHRTLSGEVTRLIENCVEEFDAELEAA